MKFTCFLEVWMEINRDCLVLNNISNEILQVESGEVKLYANFTPT